MIKKDIRPPKTFLLKTCTKCGRHLLRDPINFVRKSRAKDGLSNHCKACDKRDREEKKKKEGEKINAKKEAGAKSI